jgi:hypothetical protein
LDPITQLSQFNGLAITQPFIYLKKTIKESVFVKWNISDFRSDNLEAGTAPKQPG